MRIVRGSFYLTLVLNLSLQIAWAQRVDLVAPTEPKTAAEQQKMFHLPPGFEIQLVASEPAIQKPINLTFDAAGRMYVTSTVEYPFPAKEGTTPRDTIKLITDTNGDGVPDKVTTFADGLNIPIGVAPVADAVLGYSIPNVYRFRDSDGDGKADQRDVAYRSFGFDDTHGMASSFTWWLDGWVYACHGFRNASTVKGADGKEVVMQSGNTYRFKPDGSHIEYFTHGQVNPFGMTFDTLGNVYTADCHSKPIYMLLRGAYYPSFGKPDDGLGFGPEMISHSHGSTGICGLAFYGADNFPPEYHDTMFIGNPVTGRVNHDKLEAHGSTYKAIEQPDFITCDDPWFRPVDIKLAMDGSLYIADFYNKIIGHYEVPITHPGRDRERGRIWRVVYTGIKGKPHVIARDLTKASRDELILTLANSNILVRTFATHQLVHRVGKGVAKDLDLAAAIQLPSLLRAHAIWVLERLDALNDETVLHLLLNPDPLIRVHLIKAVSGRKNLREKHQGIADVLTLIAREDFDPFVRRAAANALGLHPHQQNIEPLLQLWDKTPADDTHLIHVARMALRDNLQALGNVAQIAARYRDQPRHYDQLADVTLGIRTAAGGEFALAYLRAADVEHARQPAFFQHAARYVAAESIGDVVSLAVSRRDKSDIGQQAALLRALRRGTQERGATLPPEIRAWGVDVGDKLLNGKTDAERRTGIDLAREFGLKEQSTALEVLASNSGRKAAVRQAALEALAALDAGRAVPVLSRTIENSAAPLAERQKGAEILGGLNTAASRAELLKSLRVVPDQVAVSIARALVSSRDGGEGLLVAVTEGKASPRLLQDAVVDGRLRALNLPGLSERLEKLLKDVPPEEDRVKQLLGARLSGFNQSKPDAARGVEVYGKICANCHRLQNKGTKVGPDLDGIGVRGIERLVEDVLVPNRNVDQAFRGTTLALKDGKVLTGLVLREEGAVLVVINEQGKEVRVPNDDIEERRLLKLSPMPANIAEQLMEGEFFDLMAYLLSQRETAVPAR